MPRPHDDHEDVPVSELPDARDLPKHKIPSVRDYGIVEYDPAPHGEHEPVPNPQHLTYPAGGEMGNDFGEDFRYWVVRICGLVRQLNNALIAYSLAEEGSTEEGTAEAAYHDTKDKLEEVARDLESGAHRVRLTGPDGLLLIRKNGLYYGAHISAESALYRRTANEIAFCHSEPSGCSQSSSSDASATPPSGG